jgi:ABC-type antimicrobial peptide transport system permease subunit
MFFNYFLTGWRNLIKNKAFSFINIFGLALGMCSSLLILLWVRDELKKDTFHAHDANLYSVYERQYHDGVVDGGFYTPGLLSDELKAIYPEVRYATPLAWNEPSAFEAQGKILNEMGNHAGPDFFLMFSYPLLMGTPETALKEPVDIAISRKMAEDFFGSPEAAYGQSIRYRNLKDLKVSAVFENIGSESSITFDYIVNWETFLEQESWARDWGNNGPETHIVLRPDADVDAFQKKFENLLTERHGDAQNKNFVIKLSLQQYSKKYLESNFKNGQIDGGRIQYVQLFSLVAFFLLLIAGINFMNLTTARSIKRAKEIGIRKVAGAFRFSLIRQFLGEAILVAAAGLVLAIAAAWFLLPTFNAITQKQIEMPLTDISFWITLISLTVFIGLFSGLYPAFYLSSFHPIRAFKGSIKFGKGALVFRKGLVVFQFALSIVLIVGTIVITRQVQFIQSAHLGYDRENLIYVSLEGDLPAKYKVLKEQAMASPGIQLVSRITAYPTRILNGTGGVVWEGKDPNAMLQFTQAAIGYDFMKTMKIEMAAGRDFSRDFPSDSVGYIVNEKALALFGYKDPIGMPLTFWQKKGTIVGIVKDFHFNSLHNAINPLVLRLGEEHPWGWAMIRTEPGKTKEALASLENICKELNPKFPFAYHFSDDEYQKLYVSEQIVDKLSNVFAALAILISCLGLLGLTLFTTQQRTKEIGIRKVLGATTFSLFHLLSKELFVLIFVAMAVASPLAWYVMSAWLGDFAYRIELGWWMFLAAGLMAVAIALTTTGIQTMKALVANPVNSLRSE